MLHLRALKRVPAFCCLHVMCAAGHYKTASVLGHWLTHKQMHKLPMRDIMHQGTSRLHTYDVLDWAVASSNAGWLVQDGNLMSFVLGEQCMPIEDVEQVLLPCIFILART